MTFLNSFMCWSRFGKNSIRQASQFFNNINLHVYKLLIWNFCSHTLLHSNMLSGILCLTKSPYSSSDLRTLSISLFSFCLAFPSTSIILVRGPLVYPSISGNIRQPKMEPSLRQNTQNRVCYVVYRLIRSSRNNPTTQPSSRVGHRVAMSVCVVCYKSCNC